MKNIPKRFILATVAVIIALVAGGLFWYASVKEKQSKLEQKQAEALSQNENTNDIDVSQWKMYKDEKMGFEVKYPGNIYYVDSADFSIVKIVSKDGYDKTKYGNILIFTEYLNSSTGKSDDSIVGDELRNKLKSWEVPSWKNAFTGAFYLYERTVRGIELNKKFFYTEGDNMPRRVVECDDVEKCDDVYGLSLFISDRMFGVESSISTSKNPIYKKFLSEFNPL
jgi:hypothetical protein